MRSLTLGLFYLVKITEVLLLTVLTGLIINEAIWLIDDVRSQSRLDSDNDTVLIVLCIVTMVIVIYHLMYHNLLTNMRFYTKMQCVTFGLCFYDCINFAICHCVLNKPCRDRCFTAWTFGKWVCVGAILGATIGLTKDFKSSPLEIVQPDGSIVLDYSYEDSTTNLDTMLIVFLLQHPIFIIARVPIFILYSLLTCCCDKGRDYPGDELFKDRVISFDFIDFELGRLNNFANHPVGRNELEYNRSLNFARRQTLREREQAEA